MKDATEILSVRFKRCMQHFVEELKERDDYEAKMSPAYCINCGKDTKVLEYRLNGEKEWKLAYQQNEVQCKSCREQKELAVILKGNKNNLRQQLVKRYEDEYWYIPVDLKDAGFKNFNVEGYGSVYNAKREALKYINVFEKEPENRYNLLFMGNPGTGKTHLATAIVRTLKEKGFLVGQLTIGTLLSKLKATYQRGADKTEESILNDISNFDLLVLDDLGSEAKSRDEFDWSKNKLFEVVNMRIGKPTIYTSNFNEQHLTAAVGERVLSRLHTNTKFIELVTKDYRKNFRLFN